MNKSALLASTAIGLLLCIAPANAQMQQKGSEEKAAPQQGPTTGPQKEQGPAEKKAEPKGKGAAQGEMKEQPGKGTAQTAPKEGKGTAEKAAEPKDKATKGTAEKSGEPKDKATKGTAEKAPEPKDKSTKGAGAEPKDKAGSANRVQLTEEKRTNVGQTFAKDTNLNRANNVNISINVGTRLPQSVRLVAVPAAIIAIVPEYRSYRYVVLNDQVCIVEPNSYEIVEIIPVSGQTAAHGSGATLVLSEDERAIILREIDIGGGSTMGLGAIAEGADVPRDVQVRAFPDAVVQKVAKVKGYKFFTAENRLAIVDPQGTKVQLVIEQRR
jgi:Protein of unknown function (DUF1236)